MKKNLFLTGMLAFMLVFSLAVVGCDSGSGGSGTEETGGNGGGGNGGGGNGGGGNGGGGNGGGATGGFTVTGIPADYNGKYANAYAINSEPALMLSGMESMTSFNALPISNGSVSIPMWNLAAFAKYSGSDTIDLVGIAIFDGADVGEADLLISIDFYEVKFTSGNATVAWSSGEIDEEDDD